MTSAAASRITELGLRNNKPASNAAQLYALRRRINQAVQARVAGPMTVGLYALAAPCGDHRGHLAEAENLASAHGITVFDRFCDATGDTAPATRPGWASALRSVVEGHTHGIIAVSRTAVSLSDQLYEEQLLWFDQHGAGLWLVRSETAL